MCCFSSSSYDIRTMEALKRCTLGAVRLARTSQILSSSLTKNPMTAASYLLNDKQRMCV